jgi:hypothetical protein
MAGEKNDRPQGFVIATEIDDRRAKNWAETHLSKFGEPKEKVFCRLLPLESLSAIARLRKECRRVEFLTYLFPVGHEGGELADFVRKNFPDVHITHIPR